MLFRSGAVDLLVAPLPGLLARVTGVDACRDARVEAVPLKEHDGVFTGELAAPPLGQEEKARRARAIAAMFWPRSPSISAARRCSDRSRDFGVRPFSKSVCRSATSPLISTSCSSAERIWARRP